MKTITRVEELKALPDLAVIFERDSEMPFQLTMDGWNTGDDNHLLPHEDIELPATLIYPLVFDAADVHVAIGVASTADPYRELHPSQAETIARAVLGAVGEVEA